MSCILLKKYYLDIKATAELNNADLEAFKQAVNASIDFNTQPIALLKRKGDVLSKIYSKLSQNGEFLTQLEAYSNSQAVKERQFAMYSFEVLSEMHLSSEELTASKENFKNIFDKALQDTEVLVKVAALKAIAAFISAIDDQDVVMEFAPVLPALLKTIVTVLQVDEEQGRQALDSLGELSAAHPEVWKGATAPLVELASEVCSHKDFEDGTRSAAIEVVLSLSEAMPAALRKLEETKTLFFPALVKMLMESEDDD